MSSSISLASTALAVSDLEAQPQSLHAASADGAAAEKTVRPAVSHKVPPSERRGLLSWVSLVPELDDARNYGPYQKLLLVFVVACAGTTGPMGTSIILPAVEDVARLLHTSETMVNVLVGIFLLSLGVFPMWWSNFSERHGRRPVYIVSFSWFLAFSVGSAVAPSISALIVLRMLAGAGALAVQACGAATVADLYVPEERGAALGIFYLGPLLGPFLLPIIGGAVAQAWGWRATMWVMVIFCGANVVLILLFLPETLRREDQRYVARQRGRESESEREREQEHEREKNEQAEQAQAEKDKQTHEQEKDEQQDQPSPSPVKTKAVTATLSARRSGSSTPPLLTEPAFDSLMPSLSRLSTNVSRAPAPPAARANYAAARHSYARLAYDYIVRPTHAIVLLGYPPVTLAVAYSAVSFMGVYFFNIAITNEYSAPPYDFSPIIVGLMYVPNSVTYILASVLGGRWNDRLLRRHARRHNGELRPEARLSWNLVTAAALYPPACLIFGWCLDKHTMWLVPLVGTALFGFASMLVIGITLTYIIDVLPGKGATGVALNNLVRQIFAATATFVTKPLLNALGPGVLLSIYVGVLTLALLCMWYLKRNGADLRARHDLTDYYARL